MVKCSVFLSVLWECVCTCALVTAGGRGGRGLRVNKSNTVSVEVFFLCQCKLNILKFKKDMYYSLLCFMVHKKRGKSSFLTFQMLISMASGDTRSIL